MVGIDSRVDVRDDAAAREMELLLGSREGNHLGGRLIDVARPHGAAVILNRSGVDQRRRRIGGGGATGNDGDDLIELGIHDARQGADDREQQIRVEQVGRDDDEERVENAVNRGEHLAIQEEALALQAVGVGGADDQAIAEEQAVGADQIVDRDVENAGNRLQNAGEKVRVGRARGRYDVIVVRRAGERLRDPASAEKADDVDGDRAKGGLHGQLSVSRGPRGAKEGRNEETERNQKRFLHVRAPNLIPGLFGVLRVPGLSRSEDSFGLFRGFRAMVHRVFQTGTLG